MSTGFTRVLHTAATTLALACFGAGCADTTQDDASNPEQVSANESLACDPGPDGSVDPKPDAGTPDSGTPGTGVTLVPHPSWTCGVPEGAPPPELGTPAFEATLTVANTYDLGTTQFGARKVLAFGAGTFKGTALNGTLLGGSFEQPLTLSNGTFETEQVLTLRSTEGNPIYLRVCGFGTDAASARVVTDFEAPNNSKYAALNKAKLVGTREVSADGKQVKLRLFDVSKVALPAQKVTVQEPPGLVQQTWACKEDKGTKGAEIYRETVGIGGSITVGASKNGTRNIIPITGGTTSGRVPGKVLALGADYQLLGSGFYLDARYVVRTNDGEYIIVRNCGPASALIPVFEAKADGKYAFLNKNEWLSSSPGIGLGSVTLTIYEKR